MSSNFSSPETRVGEEGANHTPLTPPSQSSPAVSGRKGVLDWLYSSDTSTKPEKAAFTESQASSSFPWSYLSWAQSMLSSSTPAGDKTECDENSILSAVESPDKAERRKSDSEEFANECIRYYQAHSQERVSQMPLVGMRKGRGHTRQLSLALRALEGIEEKTRAAMLRVLSKQSSRDSEERSEYTDVCLDDHASHVTLLSDLACIGGLSHLETSHTLPALHSVSWAKCYMQLELVEDDKTGAKTSATQAITNGVQQNSKHANHFMQTLVQSMRLFLEQARSLVVSSEGYLAGQLLLEESFNMDQTIALDSVPVLDQAMSFAISSSKYLAGQLLMDDGLSVDETFLLDSGPSCDRNISTDLHITSEEMRVVPNIDTTGSTAKRASSVNEAGMNGKVRVQHCCSQESS